MKSIRAKLIAPFLIGMLALTLALSLYTYSSARHAVKDAVITISEAKTNQVITSMTLFFRSLLATVQNVVVDPHVLSLFQDISDAESIAVGKSTSEWIQILTQGNEYYRDIFITDSSGVCIVSSNPGHIGKSFIDTPAVVKALGGMFTIDDFTIGRITKKLSCTVAGPVDNVGEIVGAIVMISDFPQIVNYDGDDSDASLIFTALLQPGGMFASHRNQELMGNENALFPALYEQLKDVGRGAARSSICCRGEVMRGMRRSNPSAAGLSSPAAWKRRFSRRRARSA